MIELYSAATPNGHKISIALEELGLPYELKLIDLGAGQQQSSDFLELNPNGKIPAIVDTGNQNFTVFESAAILLYIAEKTQQLNPKETNKKSEVIQWLMLQVGGVGPMMGQANVWFRYMDVSYQPAIDRYQREVKRLLGILDQRLGGREFLVDEFSIADIAHWAWVRTHFWSGVEIDDLPNLSAWVERLARRPGCQRGVDCQPLEVSAPADKSKFIKNARSMLVS